MSATAASAAAPAPTSGDLAPLQIELLPPLSGAESDEGVQAEETTVIKAGDMRPWALIKAGRRPREPGCSPDRQPLPHRLPKF